MRYEPVAKPRFQIERVGAGEQIRVKARRQVMTMLFMPVWLILWTGGGVAAFTQMMRDFEPFLALWLGFWAVAWIAVAGSFAWMVSGSETIRVVGSDLEIAHHLFGLSRRWLYEGGRVRDLRLAEQPSWAVRSQLQLPFFNRFTTGAVKFDYGARTIHALGGMDEAEGRMVIERLRPQLPASR